MSLASFLKARLIPAKLDEQINRIRKPIGSLGYDPWGFNNETFKYGFSLTKPIYENYFRTESHGVEHVPAEGPVLIVGNHSGQLPIDGILVGYAIASRENNPRIPRAMIERFFPTVPWLGNLLNGVGATLGDPVNCARMLANNEAIIVFPEGVRGSGKLYRDRYKLQRFGSGFMHLAMKYNAAIVPVGIVGCEETIPAIANIKPLAKALGVPYAPVAMPLILPAKVHLNFGPPMYFEGGDISEEQVNERVKQVKAEVNRLINKGLTERKGLF